MKFAIYALLVALGIAAHFCKKLMDLENAGTILKPTTFARQHPYTVASAILGAYLLAAALYYMGQMNEAVAIMTGVTCGSAFDSLRARAVAKLQNGGQ